MRVCNAIILLLVSNGECFCDSLFDDWEILLHMCHTICCSKPSLNVEHAQTVTSALNRFVQSSLAIQLHHNRYALQI